MTAMPLRNSFLLLKDLNPWRLCVLLEFSVVANQIKKKIDENVNPKRAVYNETNNKNKIR